MPVPAPVSAALDPKAAAPGGSAAVGLERRGAGRRPGDYLLLLDVVTPTHGALSTLGSTPALIRVSVTGQTIAPSPSPSPARRQPRSVTRQPRHRERPNRAGGD